MQSGWQNSDGSSAAQSLSSIAGGEGRSDRYAEIAAEFVQRKVDVIVTAGIAVPALMKVTSVIPVVIALGSDPVGSGQVASLAEARWQHHRPIASIHRACWQET